MRERRAAARVSPFPVISPFPPFGPSCCFRSADITPLLPFDSCPSSRNSIPINAPVAPALCSRCRKVAVTVASASASAADGALGMLPPSPALAPPAAASVAPTMRFTRAASALSRVRAALSSPPCPSEIRGMKNQGTGRRETCVNERERERERERSLVACN